MKQWVDDLNMTSMCVLQATESVRVCHFARRGQELHSLASRLETLGPDLPGVLLPRGSFFHVFEPLVSHTLSARLEFVREWLVSTLHLKTRWRDERVSESTSTFRTSEWEQWEKADKFGDDPSVGLCLWVDSLAVSAGFSDSAADIVVT